MLEFLTLVYLLGAFLLLIALVHALDANDLPRLLKESGITPKTNGTAIVIALLLISVWPILVIKPIYNYLRKPCYYD